MKRSTKILTWLKSLCVPAIYFTIMVICIYMGERSSDRGDRQIDALERIADALEKRCG